MSIDPRPRKDQDPLNLKAKLSTQKPIELNKLSCCDLQKDILDICLIIKGFYPHRDVINKYQGLIKQYLGDRLEQHQLELLSKLIKAITLLHQIHRYENKWGQFYSEKEDVLIALFLLERELPMLNRSSTLCSADRRFYSCIYSKYSTEVFKRKAIMKLMDLSKTNTVWKLNQLISKGVAVRYLGKHKTDFYYKLKEID